MSGTVSPASAPLLVARVPSGTVPEIARRSYSLIQAGAQALRWDFSRTPGLSAESLCGLLTAVPAGSFRIEAGAGGWTAPLGALFAVALRSPAASAHRFFGAFVWESGETGFTGLPDTAVWSVWVRRHVPGFAPFLLAESGPRGGGASEIVTAAVHENQATGSFPPVELLCTQKFVDQASRLRAVIRLLKDHGCTEPELSAHLDPAERRGDRDVDLVRISFQAAAAVLGGPRQIVVDGFDLPGAEADPLRAVQVLVEETGLGRRDLAHSSEVFERHTTGWIGRLRQEMAVRPPRVRASSLSEARLASLLEMAENYATLADMAAAAPA